MVIEDWFAVNVDKVLIGDAASQLDVSIDTIRRWAKKGLIKASRDSRDNRVFSLSEIARLQSKLNNRGEEHPYRVLHSQKNFEKATCIDLFAGAGGTALGFHNAGLKHVLLNEFNKEAADTLQQNSDSHQLGWNIDSRNVHDVNFQGIKAQVIQAGFPCQAFSYAGKSKGFEDTRGTLFFEFARAVRDIQPDIAVGENVRGLEKHDNGQTLATMLNTFNELGYDVNYRILRAQYLDVPQKRERIFLFAVKRGRNIPIIFPKERDYVITLAEALKNVPPSPGQKYTEKKAAIMRMIPEGGNWRNLPDSLQRDFMGASYFLGGGKTGMARRMAWNEPALTLTCNPAQKQTERCHPTETRPFTVREYARIQTFPDSWIFSGSTAAQYRQIGNAVPVNLGYHVGCCVLAALGYIEHDDMMEIVEPIHFM